MYSAKTKGGPSCLLCGQLSMEPWCQATDLEYFTTADSFTYYRCAACAILFIWPVPIDRLAVIYPSNYYSFLKQDKVSPVTRVKSFFDRRKFLQLLRKLPGNELGVLDVGGGIGSALDLMRAVDQRVRRTQIVDLDSKASELARSRGHGYFEGRIEDFKSSDSFDVILLLNLIEHVANPQLVLSKVASLLSPTGVVLVKTPNYDSWDQRIFRHRNWAGFHCPRHWVLFTKNSFLGLAAKAGMQVQSARYTQGAPFWAASALIEGYRRGLVSLGPLRPAVQHPLFFLLAGIFAALDFLRSPFYRTSQMFFVLNRANRG